MSSSSTSSKPFQSLQTTCHCSTHTLSTPSLPSYLNECQCSLCRRYGAQWAYYRLKDVMINGESAVNFQSNASDDNKTNDGDGGGGGEDGDDKETAKYIWGDKTHSFDSCKKCGCVMFWFPFEREGGEAFMGINARLVTDPSTLRFVERRVTFEDKEKVLEGVYDEDGPVRK